MQPLKIEEIFKGCYLVVCSTQHELADLFMRFQEHYESPNKEYRNRGFSHEEFKVWYSKVFGNGKFTYLDDWGGFNIPGSILSSFYCGKFPDIQENEQQLLDYFKDKDLREVYIIGVHEEDGMEALEHEKSHALFYLNYSYRFRVNFLNERHRKDFAPIRSLLRRKGYCEKVLYDETNAWLCFDDTLLQDGGVDLEPLRKIQSTLRRMYARFMKETMETK